MSLLTAHITSSLTWSRFGYIEFENTDNAQAAIDALNQQTFEGRRLNVSFAHTSGQTMREGRPPRDSTPQNPPSKTLFIGNMSFEMREEQYVR